MRSKRTKPANTSLNILKLNYNTFPMKGMSDFELDFPIDPTQILVNRMSLRI